MHRERYRARRHLEATVAQLDAATEEEQAEAADNLAAAIKEYAQLFVEDEA